MKVEEKSEKVVLKLNIQKTRITQTNLASTRTEGRSSGPHKTLSQVCLGVFV